MSNAMGIDQSPDLAPTRSRTVTQFPRISVVVPARNEAKNLPHVLPGIPAEVHEVILVDGNSSDDTIAVAQQYWPGIKAGRRHIGLLG